MSINDNESNERVTDEIKTGFDSFDKNLDINIPDISQFKLLVDETMAKNKLRAKRQFLLFLSVASIILMTQLILYQKVSGAFVVAQVASITFIPLGIYLLRGKSIKEESSDE